MLKLINIFIKRSGISVPDFQAYYETKHVPLISHLVPYFVEHRRNFRLPDGRVTLGHFPNAACHVIFDVITEVWFENQAGIDSVLEALKEPAIADTIANDEQNFIDRKKMILFMMEEHVTPAINLGLADGAPGAEPTIKVIAMFKRKRGLSRENFIDYFETRHAPLIASQMRTICGYRRSYMMPNNAFNAAHLTDIPVLPNIDAMIEMWFPDQTGYDAYRDATREPRIAAMLTEDEANFLDRDTVQAFRVDERVTRLGPPLSRSWLRRLD
jgi:hypothetical protein